ncbi:NudC domain containing 1 [Nesidiocoris tenuis]|uniref:NudC domain containing 1 n=1 Tax=Nesidiocoris tenuis TaxID=355587 RepID=A0ABN7AE78_9HEMI|nr:NudC domain containing 1 [Nesidiocoris tenuis]
MVYPFNQTGIDYGGPIKASITGTRGSREIDVYLCVFVCFSTKAVHLETVLDLSTDGFLQCYDRFTARRGYPAVVWTDNGRNFLGARNHLSKLRSVFNSPDHSDSLVQHTARQGTAWKFIPPRAPHFGGIWEAAVKSSKRLIKVTLKNQCPPLFTLITYLTKIEAILNSRPLVATSSSPADLDVLTPAHFLNLRPLTAPPVEPFPTPQSFLPKWKFVQDLSQQFWSRWRHEYLSTLQSKEKWNTPDRPAKIGDIVMMMEDNAPPLQWPLARITDLHPGPDGIPRVAEIITAQGPKTRPVIKLCPLPSQE